jgi:hypothetical protein
VDFWEVLGAVVAGSLITAFGWWLSDRATRNRQWNADKLRLYAAFLADAHEIRGGAEGLPSWGDVLGPRLPDRAMDQADRAAEALERLSAGLSQMQLLGRTPVIDAALGVVEAASGLVEARHAGATVDDGAMFAAIHAFERAARKDLAVRY